jgi:phosphate/sulfate permease
MKRISITTLCVGAILGAALMLLCIWIWLIANGNVNIIAIVATIIVVVVVFVCCQVQNRVSLKNEKKAHSYRVKKYQSYYYLFGSWMVLRNKGRMLTEYFENHGFKNIAIYGLGRLGLCLYEELKNSNINVKYGIDKNAATFSYLNLKVISPEIDLEPVDIIVVTKIIEYDKIVEELRKRISCQIVSLEDVIYSM